MLCTEEPMSSSNDKQRESDLKRREYRDEEGNVHHHTHPYMEEHGRGSERNERGSAAHETERGRDESERSSQRSQSERGASRSGERSSSGRGESERRSSSTSAGSHAAHPMTDHDQIRQWAESRGAKPACVKGTGGKGDPGMIRLDFPGFTGADSLQPISWDEWFKAFDDNDLALLVQDRTASGEESNFNKLVSRETAEASGRARGKQSR
jgi:hypothetical protein